MNRIKVVDDVLSSTINNNSIEVTFIEKTCIFGINEVIINIKKDINFVIDISLNNNSKLNFNITSNPNIKFNISIITNGTNGKIQYNYNLLENSICKVDKYQKVECIKEMIIIKLKGTNAKIDYNFKTMCASKETYDYHIFHDSINTVSNIKNKGVCINNGSIIYQVSTFVPKAITGCIVNQNNRIINLTNNKCEIKPNLYIDCNDIEASHSALIDRFSDDEIFYIQSRGIDYNSSIKLLLKGFLTSEIENKTILRLINKDIDKYRG